MKPEDILRYSADQWAEVRDEQLDAEVARLGFPLVGARVLDLAAGPGAFTAALARAGATEVVWQDADELFLEVATARLRTTPEVRFELRDMLELPYADGAFDVVVLRDALHWAGDERGLLHRIARVIRPGGWLYVTNHNFRRPIVSVRPMWRSVAHLFTPALALALRRKPLPTLFVFEGLTRRRLRATGFEVVDWRRPCPADFEGICRRRGWGSAAALT
ncbi:MAG TPA: class I SAM-dependent methyltransferase [Acidimicrobiales bacterium]|nr:class I SAM-dependent methyltransferase [Acidimicrobiales bacterium]